LPNGAIIFPGEEPISLLSEYVSQCPDVFEFVYLAKDDSILYGVEVRKVRFDLGFSAVTELREKHPDWEFDHIMGVPNGANVMREGACGAF
jgi:glutamine phosphoribosylpyrophosphate amidotransferase